MPGNAFNDSSMADFPGSAELVVPNDATDFTGACTITAFDGTVVKITTANGQTFLHPIVVGVPLTVRVKRVWATGTDATKIVASY